MIERLTDDDVKTIMIHLDAIKEKFCNQLKALPSVQEQKRGQWIEHKDYPGLAYLCSECNHFTTVKSNYCPNCGAKMEGAEDDKRRNHKV